jgi:hypothetical protein
MKYGVVFIVTNTFILSIAICGQVIYRRNVRGNRRSSSSKLQRPPQKNADNAV